MAAKSTFKYVSYIRTTPEKLWHALTTTEVIKQYWFGMRVDTDWKVGSTWRFYYNGSLMDSGGRDSRERFPETPGEKLAK